MPLRGTIDRIDFNPRTGEWLILDYKTSESGDSPHTTHHGTKSPTDEPEWLDIQLPLYHYLVARSPLNVTEPIGLGYIVLPGKSETADLLRAEWTSAQLEHAWNCARDVVRNIRAGNFEMKKSAHSPYDPFARICQTTVFSGVESIDGDEEEPA
jgi:hypothetical protein